ncbi:hypothetical protein [Niallia taxi]|uniref:hypothetical protein n=1 Tax=Niallia taxi TaxID=2499688 RepID=UPI0028831D31|nr:hypothetical protein [Niallia taxi]
MQLARFLFVFKFSITTIVKREDWSALLDTIGAVAGASAVLVIGTILLNVTMILVHNKLQNRS